MLFSHKSFICCSYVFGMFMVILKMVLLCDGYVMLQLCYGCYVSGMVMLCLCYDFVIVMFMFWLYYVRLAYVRLA